MNPPLPRVKEPQLQGRWYPADPDVLARTVRDLLGAAGGAREGVLAVVVPHGVYRHSGAVAAGGFAAAGPRRRALIVGPTHFATFAGAVVLPMAGYRTPLGLVRIDEEAVAALARTPLVRANPAVFMREHAVEAQLPLLQGVSPECAIVPLLVGALGPGDAEQLAPLLRPFFDPGSLVVVSSDLVHYGRRSGYLPVPPSDHENAAACLTRLDAGALAHLVAADADGLVRYLEETGAPICGRAAIEMLLRALPAGARGERLGYTTSLEATGEHVHGIGYGAVAFVAPPGMG